MVGRHSGSLELFVLATGQDDNLGDVVLRREFFDRLRAVGNLNVFVGESSGDFIDGLCLKDTDTVYRSLRQWHSAAWRSLTSAQVWYVDKPGELQLDSRTLRRQVKLLPLLLVIRLSGGQVLRLGMAMRAGNRLPLRALRVLFRLSTMVCWRDTLSSKAFGYGVVGPDWAFRRDCAPQPIASERSYIAITYRGDREKPSAQILDALRAMSRDRNWRLVVVTQVRRDSARSLELASHLGAELAPWPEERSVAEQEAVLRDIYRRSALVVSDRLHALIIGMAEGAVPLCITDTGEPKVGRHFDAIGFASSTANLHEAGGTLAELMELQILRRDEALQALEAAQARLDGVSAELLSLSIESRDGNYCL